MKNFMKVCGITALILIVLGFVIGTTAWAVQGPEKISDIVESVTDGRVNVDFGNHGDWGIQIDDHIKFDKDYSTLSGDVQQDIDGALVRSLDIEAGACEMKLMVSGDDDFHLEAETAEKLQCYTENGELNIRVPYRIKTGNTHGRINLYVPKDFRFTEAEIELGAGTLEFEDLDAGKLEIDVGAGQIVGGGTLRAGELSLEVGAGSVSFIDMEVGKLEAEVGMGALLMQGSVTGDAELECAMGSIELTLSGREKDYNYILESAMGNVQIGSYSASGLAREQRIDNGADRDINLECSMGSIEISFTD